MADPEFELLDIGVFDDNCYFDAVVEYAKATPEDLLMQISVHDRGPEDTKIMCCPRSVPTPLVLGGGAERPELRSVESGYTGSVVRAEHRELDTRWLSAADEAAVLVTGMREQRTHLRRAERRIRMSRTVSIVRSCTARSTR